MTHIFVTILTVVASTWGPAHVQGPRAEGAVAGAPASHSDSQSAPLFESHELLTLTIEAPLKTILDDRSQESVERPGNLSYEDPEGTLVHIPFEIRTRGSTRLQSSICNFPPLRLNFSRPEVQGTLFANQDKLKLVTHCQDKRPEYEQYVLQEYLVYRLYALLTPSSYRVRLARITYIDTERDAAPRSRYAFFIESDDSMAARNKWEVIHTHLVPPDALDPVQLSLLEVFQYMIGNLDWSAFSKEPDKPDCCHNTTPIGHPAGPVFPVPYDFDLSGVIRTRHADRVFKGHLDRLGLRSVRERRYRGRCDSRPYLDGSFRVLNENREAMYALYRDQQDLQHDVLEQSLEYLDDFFEVINDPDEVQREFHRTCREF